MISIKAIVLCDGCGKVGTKERAFAVPVLRRQLEQTRDDARKRGWAHYRLTNASSNGDYCPRCQREHAKAEQSKKGARP